MIDNKKIIKELPQTLILNKKGVQNFSYDLKVAIYYCDALKKYFSVTYGKDGFILSESDFSLIKELEHIENIKEINFENGISLNINKECAEHILFLYNSLSEGKDEFESFILESDKNFLNILEYSVKNREKING